MLRTSSHDSIWTQNVSSEFLIVSRLCSIQPHCTRQGCLKCMGVLWAVNSDGEVFTQQGLTAVKGDRCERKTGWEAPGKGQASPRRSGQWEGLGGNGRPLLLSHAHRHPWLVASSPRVRPRFHTAEPRLLHVRAAC